MKNIRKALWTLLLVLLTLMGAGTAWAAEEEQLAGTVAETAWESSEDVLGTTPPLQISTFSLDQPSFGETYGDQLSEEERLIYQALENTDLAELSSSNMLQLELIQDYRYLFGMEYSQEEWDAGAYASDPAYQALREQAVHALLRAFDAYLKDNPEIFWASGLSYRFTLGLTRTTSGAMRLVISKVELYPQLYYEGILAERTAVEQALDQAEAEIGAQLSDGADRETVAGAIHDWVAAKVTYDPQNGAAASTHTITGALLDTYGHQGVCEAYAKVFHILCNRFDIPCVTAVGWSSSTVSQVDHMWNYVQMEDENWYLVDVTWDDSGDDYSREWFLAGTDRVGSTHLFYGAFTNFDEITTPITPYTEFAGPTLAETSWAERPHEHEWVLTASQDASCTAAGYRRYSCACGESYEETLAALGHSWGSWQTVTQATTSSAGLQRRVCSRCGGTEEQTVDMLPATQENLVRDFVYRLYQLTLGRTPTETEAMDWVNRLLNGSFTGAQVAEGFVNSNEYQRKNTSDTAYVEMLYQTLMNREPRTDEISFWTGYLDTGVTRGFVLEGFANSTEFQRLCGNYGITPGSWTSADIRDRNPEVTAFVTRLYRTCLGREPDDSGQTDWVTWLVNGSQTGTQVAQGFVFSAEFQRKQLSDGDFVEALYQAMFDRSSDASGKQTWLNCLASGWTREQVLAGFTGSAEFSRLCARFGIRQ